MGIHKNPHRYGHTNPNPHSSTAEAQRDHYKSEWHRYNLKRKLADLPPLGMEKFLEKVQQNTKTEVKEQNLYCRPCRKAFTNDKSYNDHQVSKRHFETVEKNGGKDDTKEYLAQMAMEGRSGKKEKIDFNNDDDFEDVSDFLLSTPSHLQHLSLPLSCRWTRTRRWTWTWTRTSACSAKWSARTWWPT